MKIRIVVGTMVMGVAMLATQAVYAEPAGIPTPMHTAALKQVKFSLRNDSKSSLQVKVGDKVITLEPGKVTDVKMEEGTKIVAMAAGTGYAAGDTLSVVSKSLDGNTVVLR